MGASGWEKFNVCTISDQHLARYCNRWQARRVSRSLAVSLATHCLQWLLSPTRCRLWVSSTVRHFLLASDNTPNIISSPSPRGAPQSNMTSQAYLVLFGRLTSNTLPATTPSSLDVACEYLPPYDASFLLPIIQLILLVVRCQEGHLKATTYSPRGHLMSPLAIRKLLISHTLGQWWPLLIAFHVFFSVLTIFTKKVVFWL